MWLASSTLALGFLHGLGADHLMAIAALAVPHAGSASRARAKAFRVAVRFALGHAAFLGVGAAFVILLGWHVPSTTEQGGELAAGVMLVILGIVGLWALRTGRMYAHRHPVGPPGTHWHLHVGRTHQHGVAHAMPLPALLGAAFAISSLRSVALFVVPAASPGGTTAEALLAMLAVAAIFALGILLSMSLFGIVLAQVLSWSLVDRLSGAAGMLTSLASIGLGMYWISRCVGS
jgi:nickel/cobalt transporter (NicO) family protein